MTDAAKFWDRIAEKYARDPIENMDGYLYTVERTRSYLNPSDKALELGCGTGTTALDLAGSVSHLLATDISSNMIKIAQDKAATEGTTNVSFRRWRCLQPMPMVRGPMMWCSPTICCTLSQSLRRRLAGSVDCSNPAGYSFQRHSASIPGECQPRSGS